MSGRVIKTLSHIRFIRSVSTPEQIEISSSAPVEAGTKQVYVPSERAQRDINTPSTPLSASVKSDTQDVRPTPDMTLSHPSPPLRGPSKRRVEPDKDTIRLIEWFRDTRHQLPSEPFDLAPWIHVNDPQKFYSALDADICLYPRTPRARVLVDDLRMLQSLNRT